MIEVIMNEEEYPAWGIWPDIRQMKDIHRLKLL
jgi:hypothetical protein